MQNLSVVVVTYNSSRWLERCLESVTGRGHEVVVVDNASTDGSPELVRRRFPEVRVVELDRNLGYGGANNVGFQVTEGEYVLVLNPDAWALDGAVQRLLQAADAAPWAALVGPRLLRPDGTREQSVRGFPTVWRLATEYLFLRWLAPSSRTLNAFYGAGTADVHAAVEWIVGAVMLVRRAAFEEVGGFDPSFFMYDDEVDLAYRLRERNWEVMYYPLAEFVHVGGASTDERPDVLLCEQLRSHVRFLAKHHGEEEAHRGRKLLLASMQLRAGLLGGERRRAAAAAARWLKANDVASLLASSAPPRPAPPVERRRRTRA
jgi:GT2 family glycosyltransferase